MFSFILAVAASKLLLRDEEKQFIHFMRDTNQLFTGDEYHLRLGIFLANLRYIQQHNARESTFKLGLTPFATYTPSEYRAILGNKYSSESTHKAATKSNKAVPDEVDWRKKGVVNPIKSQHQCGSCYIFGPIQAAESSYAIKYGQLLSFSEQNIVDCIIQYAIFYQCFGCSGGQTNGPLSYLRDHQDRMFMLDSEYPYTGREEECKWNKDKGIGYFNDYIYSGNDEISLKETIAEHGPVSVSMDASQTSFTLYSSGIYDEPNCNRQELDHSVGVIGYGSENGVDFWVIRNSWSENWGEKGYMRLIRNKGDKCGITRLAFAVDTSKE